MSSNGARGASGDPESCVGGAGKSSTPKDDSGNSLIRDDYDPAPVSKQEVVFQGQIWDVMRESFSLGDEGVQVREFVRHPGAVAVVALDDQDRVCVIQQYRHPVRTREWEIPAGLLDVADEPAHLAAARELHEEVDLVAREWHHLIDTVSSPGGLDESLRIFLARGLDEVPESQRHQRRGEEAGMPRAWVSLDDLVASIMAGGVHNGALINGVFATYQARTQGWSPLRPADHPWLQRPRAARSLSCPGH